LLLPGAFPFGGVACGQRIRPLVFPVDAWDGEITVYKDHFCQGAKMYNQSFRLGF